MVLQNKKQSPNQPNHMHNPHPQIELINRIAIITSLAESNRRISRSKSDEQEPNPKTRIYNQSTQPRYPNPTILPNIDNRRCPHPHPPKASLPKRSPPAALANHPPIKPAPPHPNPQQWL